VSSLVDQRINADHIHVWPFPNSCPIDVRFLILDRRQDVPLHRPDHLEVVVYQSGEMGYECEGHTCTLRKNNIMLAGDRIRHRGLRLGGAQREPRAVVLSFLPKLIDAGAPLSDDLQYLMPFNLLDASFPNVIPASKELVREINVFLERIYNELPGASERSRLAIKTYLKLILLTLVNHYSELSVTRESLLLRQSNTTRLAPVFEHIEQNYNEPIRVDEAARLCGMSDFCFMRFFKQLTNQSFLAYLNHFRIARAQNLLASSDKPIVDISLETGFCNQSYFGVIFRRITGMTPLEYRLCHRKARFGAALTPSAPSPTAMSPSPRPVRV
jgi:AraC-like DNA-binding protein